MQAREIPTPRGPMRVSRAAAVYNINHLTIRQRIKLGWADEDLLKPPRTTSMYETGEGPMTLKQIMARTGLTHAAVRGRIRNGWHPKLLIMTRAERYARD
jgi:hypothetical protein